MTMSVTTSSGDTDIRRMEQEVKRMKLTKESITVDIACSISKLIKVNFSCDFYDNSIESIMRRE